MQALDLRTRIQLFGEVVQAPSQSALAPCRWASNAGYFDLGACLRSKWEGDQTVQTWQSQTVEKNPKGYSSQKLNAGAAGESQE